MMRAGLTITALVVALVGGCADGTAPNADPVDTTTRTIGEFCQAPPLLPAVAFPDEPSEGIVDWNESGLSYLGVQESLDGFVRLAFRRPAGDTVHVKARLPLTAWPLEAGATYGVAIEYIYGFPSLSSLVISDAAGVVVAAASDQTPGGRVFRDGPPLPGVQLSLGDRGCASRPHDNCYDAIYNLRLVVTTSTFESGLGHGDEVTFDGMTLTCLVAQRVDYSPQCADAGLVSVSWMAVRTGNEMRNEGLQ